MQPICDRELHEECGVFGVVGVPDAANLTYYGLHSLQHRGQEGCGIVSVSKEGAMRRVRGEGLVTEVFNEAKLSTLTGDMAIGHVRYSTAGGGGTENIQPFLFHHNTGDFALAHNGNIVNADLLRNYLENKGSLFQSTSDSEVFAHLIKKEVRNHNRPRIYSIIEALKRDHINFEISGRVKSLYSIWSKMQRKQIPFEEIYDLFAIRIVFKPLPFPSEKTQCWQIFSTITDIYTPKPDRLRDWISMPKANGYEALHSTVMGPDGVWVEVQIRTQRMEEIAERGFAAHWKYKNASLSNNEDELDRWLKKIRDALNGPTENAVDFLDNFKLSLYTSEIAVFTPKGEARKMPYGATALDFAYDIHSKIGNSAIGAKINHKIEPITTQINSGDQIEIITADNARPKAEWLDIVTTTKAKQAIKSFLKRERQNNIERGMKMLEERMQQLNTPLSGRVLRKIVPIYESNNKEELYSKIGAGIVDLKDLDKVLKVNATSKILKFWTLFINKKEDEEGDDAENPEPNKAKAEESATASEPQFVMAECCKPIPGDSVVGYKDPASNRIIVHKSDCKELDRLAAQFGRNILKDEIKWSQHKAMSYLSTIELRGIDRTGILLDLAKTVSEDFSINIRQINIQTHDNIFEGTISLYVKDAEGLHAIMDKIRKIKGIDTVKRNQD